MRNVSVTIVLFGVLSACVQQNPPPPTAPAPAAPAAAAPAPAAPPAVPADRIVSIEGAGCDRFLQLSDEDRAAASMFYIGYEARRFKSRSINVALIPSIGGVATDFCAAEPQRRVADVFAEAYQQTRRW